MCDYFNKFLVRDATGVLRSSATPSTATPVKVTSESTDPVTPIVVPKSDLHGSELKVTPDVHESKKDLEKDAHGNISLWETKVRKTVLPNQLVWAPFYRFGGKPFCARVCENDEVERDLYIKTPLGKDEIVVEFLRSPKTKALNTRLITVNESKLIPFYGKVKDNEEANETEWNAGYMNKMLTVSFASVYMFILKAPTYEKQPAFRFHCRP